MFQPSFWWFLTFIATIHWCTSKILRDAEGIDLQFLLELLLHACQPPQQPSTKGLVVTRWAIWNPWRLRALTKVEIVERGQAIEFPQDAEKHKKNYGPIEKSKK